MTRRRWWCALGLAASLAVAAPSALAGIDDDETQPPPSPNAAWLVRVPPQATVIVDERGNVVFYEDPANPSLTCRSVLECWGIWTQGIYGIAILSPPAAAPPESSP